MFSEKENKQKIKSTLQKKVNIVKMINIQEQSITNKANVIFSFYIENYCICY